MAVVDTGNFSYWIGELTPLQSGAKTDALGGSFESWIGAITPIQVHRGTSAPDIAVAVRDFWGDRALTPHSIAVYVDWDDDGDFDEPIEDISNYIKRVTWQYGLRRAFDPVAGEQECSIVLSNLDQRFSPENPASPLTGNLLPRKKIEIRTTHNASGEVVQYSGFIERVQASPFARRPECVIEGHGWKKDLEDQEVHLALQTNVTADEVIATIVTATGLSITTDLETGRVTFPYVGDNWREGINAYQALESLTVAERGRLFFDKDGTLVFWNAHHLKRLETAARDMGIWSDVDYAYGERIINKVTVKAKPRTISDSATDLLWQLQNTLTIKAGETKTIRAGYTLESSGTRVGGTGLVDPTGSNLSYTGSLDFTYTYGADSAEIAIENTGGGQGQVEVMKLYGKAVISRDVEVTVEDATSVALYGERFKAVNAPLLATENEARYLAQAILNRQKNAASEIRSVTLQNRNDDNLLRMLGWDVGALVNLVVPQIWHDADHHIIGAKHDWRVGNKHETTFILEPRYPYDAWLLGVTGRSEVGATTRVG